MGRGRSKPDVGLDPRTLGSRPEPKADAQPLSHPGAPAFDLDVTGCGSDNFIETPALKFT